MKTSTVAVVLIVFLSAWLTSAQTSSPTTPHRAFVDVDGSQLYYEEDVGAKAVVLLHDGVVNSAVWDDVWPAFCKDFHTIRYDRRAYGRSPATKNLITKQMILRFSSTTGKLAVPRSWPV